MGVLIHCKSTYTMHNTQCTYPYAQMIRASTAYTARRRRTFLNTVQSTFTTMPTCYYCSIGPQYPPPHTLDWITLLTSSFHIFQLTAIMFCKEFQRLLISLAPVVVVLVIFIQFVQFCQFCAQSVCVIAIERWSTSSKSQGLSLIVDWMQTKDSEFLECTPCDKQSRSRNAMWQHMTDKHEQNESTLIVDWM